MTTVTLTSSEQRHTKAILIAADSGQWLRPDRLILGELRAAEVLTFLRAINIGHPGSLTTVHADTPSRAVEQLALMVLQSGAQLRREDIVGLVGAAVDIFVQLERRDGRRWVSSISWKGLGVSERPDWALADPGVEPDSQH